MNCEILSYLGYFILAVLAYLIIAPIPKLIYYKIKYGKEVDIYYFPIIGLIGQILIDIVLKQDAFYTEKRIVEKNKNLKIHISNDLKGGVHFSLVDPQLKKLVYLDQDSYKKIEGMPFSDTFMEKGLLFQYGEGWSHSRKMLTKHFTYDDLLAMVVTLKDECQKLQLKDGPIDILNLVKSLTSTTITKTFFGSDNINTATLGIEVNKNMEEMVKFFINPFVLLRCFALKLNKSTTSKWLLSSAEKTFLQKLQSQKQSVINEIDKRIAQIQENTNVEDNILTTMSKEILSKQITKEEAIHQYFTLLIAGIDSTSHVIKNCCYALAKYSDIQERLRVDLQSKIQSFSQLNPSQIGSLKLLQYFIDETFRHYTAVPSLFNRIAIKDLKLGNFTITKGQSIDVNLIMSHFDPKLYPNPHKFDIDRWNQTLSDSFAFTPFSAGGRNCIGQHLALLEIKTILIYLLLNYNLTLNKGKITLGLANLYGPTRTDFLILTPLNSK